MFKYSISGRNYSRKRWKAHKIPFQYFFSWLIWHLRDMLCDWVKIKFDVSSSVTQRVHLNRNSNDWWWYLRSWAAAAVVIRYGNNSTCARSDSSKHQQHEKVVNIDDEHVVRFLNLNFFFFNNLKCTATTNEKHISKPGANHNCCLAQQPVIHTSTIYFS